MEGRPCPKVPSSPAGEGRGEGGTRVHDRNSNGVWKAGKGGNRSVTTLLGESPVATHPDAIDRPPAIPPLARLPWRMHW